MSSEEKIEYNKKMIGKKVLIVSRYPYEAIVVEVVDENTLAVKRSYPTEGRSSAKLSNVDIFNVRSVK